MNSHDTQALYQAVAQLRNQAWAAASDISAHDGIEYDTLDVQTNAEAFWYDQGKAEAFAQIMTMLEAID